MTERKRLLIVEEALRDREGHWFEYNRATKAAVQENGDVDVEMLGNITMEASVANELGAIPHFRYTVWDHIYNQLVYCCWFMVPLTVGGESLSHQGSNRVSISTVGRSSRRISLTIF